MTAGKDRLVILQKRQLMLLDTSNPIAPQQMATLELASKDQERELIDAEFLGDGSRWLAVLEAYENKVHLVDVADPAHPVLAGGVILSKAVGEPFSIDMALADDGQSVWVLQGPNMRLAGKRLLDGVKGVWRDVRKLEFRKALGTAGDAVVGATMPPQRGLCRVAQARLSGGELSLVQSIPLPDGLFPYFVQPDGHGSLYVSGINRAIDDLSQLELSMDGLMALIDMVKNVVQLGRVLKVDTRNGRVQQVLQGCCIYYDLDILPGGQLMTSTIRLGAGYLPPRVTLDWGLEAVGEFAKLREVANSTTALTDAIKKLLPPYDYERIGVQR
jgi:hypothetical protein